MGATEVRPPEPRRDACTTEDNRILRLAELLEIELVATKVDGRAAWTSANRITPTKMDTIWDGRIAASGLNDFDTTDPGQTSS